MHFLLKKLFGNTIDGNLVSDYKEISGNGVEALVEDKLVHVGNSKLMHSMNISTSELKEIGSIIYVAINRQYVGYLVISDVVKEEASSAINTLNHNNINTIMLTGDSAEVAYYVAKELSITKVYSELLPQEKVTKLEDFLNKPSQYGKVAFVGDGINDAPVLMRADIGIAMGGLGSDAAIEAADAVIMDDSLSKIETAIQISQKTMRIVWQNIYFAIIVKLLILVLSTFGISTMWEAVFADVGVSFIAILNAMRAFKS